LKIVQRKDLYNEQQNETQKEQETTEEKIIYIE